MCVSCTFASLALSFRRKDGDMFGRRGRFGCLTVWTFVRDYGRIYSQGKNRGLDIVIVSLFV